MNPAPNDQTATLGGNKADGFGNAPLDTARKFLTPEYYGRFLRKSTMTQEEGDRQQAMNNLITSGKAAESGIQFASQMDAKQREANIEFRSEALANQLSSLTNRPRLEPSPPGFLCEKYYNQTLGVKKPHRVAILELTSMNTFQIIYAINRMLAVDVTLLGNLRTLIPRIFPNEQSATRENLVVLATMLNANQSEAKSTPGLRGEPLTGIELYRQILDSLKNVTDNRVSLRQNAQIWSELIGVSEGEAAKQMFRSPTQPQGSAERTMLFSKVQPEVTGRRPGDVPPSNAAPAASARPPKPSSISAWTKLPPAAKDALLVAYGLPTTGTRAAQWLALQNA
jgi:hypothetical protein